MPDAQTPAVTGPPAPARTEVAPAAGGRSAERGRRWALVGAAVLVTVVTVGPTSGIGPGMLTGDLGIQYALGGRTAAGAVPLVDFEHTWNVGSWWFNAALHRLAAGDPSTWLFLWGRLFGPVLAALAAVAVAARLRLAWPWVLLTAASWLVLSHVVHSKYAIPVLWVLALLPVGRLAAGGRAAWMARAAVAGVTFLAHVELALLLGAGVVLADLADAPDGGRWWDGLAARARRAAAVPVGIAVALTAELAGYAAIGQPAGGILRQLFTNAAETAEGFNWHYPLLTPVSLRPKLFAASLLVAFVPLVWRRLGPAARLVACLHLAQSLIALRRPDPNHVDAAVTLLGLLVALVVHDLVTDPRGIGPVRWPWRGRPPGRWVPAALVGAAWIAVAVAGGFAVPHLAAIVLLVGVLGAGVVLAHGRDVPAVSVGALVAVAAVLLTSTVGGVVAALAEGDDDSVGRAIAAAVAAPLQACTGGDDRVWVVAEPLTLYDHLDLENPTPWWAFWYSFAAEHDRVRDRLAAGAIPAILQVGGWPASVTGVVPDIEAAMAECATVGVPDARTEVTIWTARTD